MEGSPFPLWKWETVYQRFRRWQRRGVFQRVFDTLDDTHDLQVVMATARSSRFTSTRQGAQKWAPTT